MIDITRYVTDGGGHDWPRPLVEKTGIRSAMPRLLFDFLPNTTDVRDLRPDKLVLEVQGARRHEFVEFVAFKHILVPLVLVVRQYLLMLEGRENFAKMAVRQLRETKNPNIFSQQSWIPAYKLPAVSLPGKEWDPFIQRFPEQVAFATALMEGVSSKYFEKLMDEKPPLEFVHTVMESYDHQQSEIFSEHCETSK